MRLTRSRQRSSGHSSQRNRYEGRGNAAGGEKGRLEEPVRPDGRQLLCDRRLGSAQVTLPALINAAVGIVNAAEARPISLQAFTTTDAKIIAIDVIDDPGRIAEADLAILGR